MISQDVFKLKKIPTELNPSDMGTKILPLSKFNTCKSLLNIDSGQKQFLQGNDGNEVSDMVFYFWIKVEIC